VQFTADGQNSSSASLNATGAASTQMTFPAAGSHQLSATYQGDANNQASPPAPAITLRVQAQPPTANLVKEVQALDQYLGAVAVWDEQSLPGGPAAAIADLKQAQATLDIWLPILEAQLAQQGG
jgi:hypothetical protein